MKTWRQISTQNAIRRFNFPFPIMGAGYYTNQPDVWQKNQVRCFNYVEIGIRISALEDHAVDIIRGKRYETKFPHAIIKPYSEYYKYDVECGREALLLDYPLNCVERFEKIGFDMTPRIWKMKMTHKISSLIHFFTEFMDTPLKPGDLESLDIAAFQLLEEILFQEVKLDTDASLNKTKIQEIADYFQLHFMDDISLDDILRRHGFSHRSFYRHWNTVFDIKPIQYINNLKLERAQKFLLETDLPVADLAEMFKFNDTTYFISMFKRRFGQTPHQFRLNALRMYP